MVRTGARANVLATLLERAGHVADSSRPRAPRLGDFHCDIAQDLLALYWRLGGTQQDPKLRPGAWDLTFDGILVELDEELHFNRYRRLTIETQLGSATPWASFYLNACVRHEPECLQAGRWGARWTSPSTARLFGEAAQPGNLENANGAPRWKQRAIYDAIKDAAALTLPEYRVARLAVWDEVGGVRLGEALEGRASLEVDALSQLLAARTTPAR